MWYVPCEEVKQDASTVNVGAGVDGQRDGEVVGVVHERLVGAGRDRSGGQRVQEPRGDGGGQGEVGDASSTSPQTRSAAR